MQTNTLLLKTVVLVVLGSRLEVKKSYRDLAQQVLKRTKISGQSSGNGSDDEIALSIKDTLDWLSTIGDNGPIPAVDIVARFELSTSTSGHASDFITKSLEGIDEHEQDRIVSRCKLLESEIAQELEVRKLKALLKDASRTISMSDDFVDKGEFLKKTIEELEDVRQRFSGQVQEAEDDFDIGDVKALTEMMRQAQEQWSPHGMLKLGYQGVNDFVGGDGIPRGFFVNINALSHHYKTGMLLDAFTQLPRYNTPYMLDKTKTPMIFRVSFENKPAQDLPDIYKKLYELETGKYVKKSQINPEESAQYLSDKLQINGYRLGWKYYTPNGFTVEHLIAVLEDYIEKGFEIHALIVDYLELICKGGGNRRDDLVITDSIERLRGFCYPRGITVFNAHQLNTKAKELSRDYGPTFVKKMAEGGWSMNCQSLQTKVDLDIALHIVKTESASYLTMARGKMRGETDVPENRRACAYKFEKLGGLVEDICMEQSLAIYDLNGLHSLGSMSSEWE